MSQEKLLKKSKSTSTNCTQFIPNSYNHQQCSNCFGFKSNHPTNLRESLFKQDSVFEIRATLNKQNNILRKSAVSKEQKILFHLQNIQGEILSTENSYVEQLNKLIRNYHTPMIENKIILPKSNEEKAIFGNVRILEHVHSKILNDIRTVHSREGFQVGLISDRFIEAIPYFRLYSEYVTRFDYGTELIRTILTQKDKNELFEKCCSIGSYKASRLQLNSLRIAPIQRLARYILLFKDLVKYTNPKSPDYEKFINIRDALIKLTEDLEQIRVDEDNKQKLSKINIKLKKKNILASSTDQHAHHFKKQIKVPSFCPICRKLIIRHHYVCSECSLDIHVSCRNKTLPTCNKSGSLLSPSRKLILSQPMLHKSLLNNNDNNDKEEQIVQGLLFTDCIVFINNYESDKPSVNAVVRWESKTTNNICSISCNENIINITCPRTKSIHILRFEEILDCNKWHSEIKTALSTWKSRNTSFSIASPVGFRKTTSNIGNMNKAKSNPDDINNTISNSGYINKGPKRFEGTRSLELKEVYPVLTKRPKDNIRSKDSFLIDNAQFSISTTVPVKINDKIEFIFTINILKKDGYHTVLKFYDDFIGLDNIIKSCNLYDTSNLPNIPPKHTDTQIPQHRIQKQSRDIELYLNEVSMLSPPVMDNQDIKSFFENSNEFESSFDIDIIPTAFSSSSLLSQSEDEENEEETDEESCEKDSEEDNDNFDIMTNKGSNIKFDGTPKMSRCITEL